MDDKDGTPPRIGVGCVVLRGKEVLLIRRAKPPAAGQWSLPGGKQRWGETVRQTALREVWEETGVSVRLLGLVDVVDLLPVPDNPDAAAHFTLIDFVGVWTGGEPKPGDDAAEAVFHPLDALDALGLWEETTRIIRAAASRVISTTDQYEDRQ